MRFTKVLISSAVVAAAFTGPAFAADPAASGIAFGGAFDFSYDWAANDVVSGHVFDNEDDAFVFHQANLSATKAFDGGVGVGLNVILGKDANVVSGDLLDGDDFDVTQAYISKAFGNLTLTGGRYVTLAGMEVINPSGNLNASRSLLFARQPLVHEGVRASYKLSDALSVTLGLNNSQFATSCGPAFGALGGGVGVGCTQGGAGVIGFSGQRDNNTDTTIEAQVAFTPNKMLSVFLTGYTGNEDFGDGGGFGNSANLQSDTLDLVVNLNLTDMIYVGLNADYFNTEDGAGGHFETKGVAGYAQVKLMPKLRVALRSEYVSADGDAGFGFGGIGQSIRTENTLTVGYAVSDNLELLLEGRHDRARGGGLVDVDGDGTPDFLGNEVFAPIDGDIEDDQYTGTVKVIAKF
ncbi:MAG: hypothetical protein K0Q76_2259 [Panacagrimonas sp.]|jgi:hypothetical protein|nr:outer membrane beta-barrel protein [Panacagrimonas sp.]MCC2657151.1 hypothetical protein [Panacagrimonas sp.]